MYFWKYFVFNLYRNLNYAEQKWVERIINRYNHENFKIKTDEKEKNIKSN